MPHLVLGLHAREHGGGRGGAVRRLVVDVVGLAVSGVGQPLEGEVLRLGVDKVVLVELRLQDPGGRHSFSKA